MAENKIINEDDISEKFTFSKEYDLGDEKINEMTMREPTLKEMASINSIKDPVEGTNQLIRILSGKDTITNDEFGAMRFRDYVKLQGFIEGLPQ